MWASADLADIKIKHDDYDVNMKHNHLLHYVVVQSKLCMNELLLILLKRKEKRFLGCIAHWLRLHRSVCG